MQKTLGVALDLTQARSYDRSERVAGGSIARELRVLRMYRLRRRRRHEVDPACRLASRVPPMCRVTRAITLSPTPRRKVCSATATRSGAGESSPLVGRDPPRPEVMVGHAITETEIEITRLKRAPGWSPWSSAGPGSRNSLQARDLGRAGAADSFSTLCPRRRTGWYRTCSRPSGALEGTDGDRSPLAPLSLTSRQDAGSLPGQVRRRLAGIARAASTAGMAHAKPESIGTKDRPCRPRYDSGRSTRVAPRAR